MEKRGLFIEPSAQKKWWFAIQRGETTAEHITKYFANREAGEHLRNVYKSFYVTLKELRTQLKDGILQQAEYQNCHDVIARMFLFKVREKYSEATANIVSKYLTIFDGKEVCDDGEN